jgi:hypothetical protein
MSLFVVVFTIGMVSAHFRMLPYQVFIEGGNALDDWLENWQQYLGAKPTRFLGLASHAGNGVTIRDSERLQPGVTLLTGLRDNAPSLWLIDSTGNQLHKWNVSPTAIWPNPIHVKGRAAVNSDWDTDIHGAVLFENGDVIFNFEYLGLVRLDRCGNVVWKLSYMTHHSIEPDGRGNFWVSGRRYMETAHPSYLQIRAPYWDPTALLVSQNGKILREISLLEVLYRGGQHALIFVHWNGYPQNKGAEPAFDWGHLNDIEEITAEGANASSIFEPGDVLVSMRDLNTIFVFSAKTLALRWLKTGPWQLQHDPDFLADGRISVYDNRTKEKVSRIVVIDPSTNAIEEAFSGTPDKPFENESRGKHQWLANGNLLIADWENGRSFEVAPNGDIVWQFVDRYDDDEVRRITDAIRYPVRFANFTKKPCK